MSIDDQIDSLWSRLRRKGQEVYERGTRFSTNGKFIAIHTLYYPPDKPGAGRSIGSQFHVCRINKRKELRRIRTFYHPEWCCYAINDAGDILLTVGRTPGVFWQIINKNYRKYDGYLLGFNSQEKSFETHFEIETSVAKYQLTRTQGGWDDTILELCVEKKFDKQHDIPCTTVPTNLSRNQYKGLTKLLSELRESARKYLTHNPRSEIAHYICGYVDEAIPLIGEIQKGDIDGGQTSTVTCLDLEERMKVLLEAR